MSNQQQEKERQSIIAKLQELDHHGVWTDEQSKNEGYRPLSLREARAKLADMMAPKNQ